MLYTFMKITLQFLVLLIFPLPLIAENITVTPEASTYQYVPQEVITKSGYKDEKDKRLFDKSLNKVQKQGANEGKEFAKGFLSKLNKLEVNKDALNIVNAQKQLINKTYQFFNDKHRSSHKSIELYYFISFSMPDALIKAYLYDCIWNGGTLVLRGIHKGMTIPQFLQKYIVPLVQFKGVHARIMINPNLFEEYNVNVVPTILIAERNTSVKGCKSHLTEMPDKVIYQKCQESESTSFWKISGNVTSLYALSELSAAGAPVDSFISNLKKRIPLVTKDKQSNNQNKLEQGFTGDWQKLPMPISDLILNNAIKNMGLYQTSTGAITSK